MTVPDIEVLHRRMVEGLAAAGTLTEEWRPAFDAVPRHAFIPDLTWHHGTVNGKSELIQRHRTEDPGGWLSAAYQDDSVITQVDDGDPSGSGGTGLIPTSSISMPSVVAAMLRALDIHDGQKVLEIGTGTGYNAALLAHRLGAQHVTTVEINPALARVARHALNQAGYRGVTVVTADGAQGFLAGAPYDRVLSTASCEQVPYPWVAQTVPGGRVLTPWRNAYYPGGLLSLTVGPEGTAAGRIVNRAWFMQLRDQRVPRCTVADVVRGDYHGERCTTSIGPYELAGHRGAMLASCGSSIRGPARGPAISTSLRIAARTSSACVSGALAGCGMKSPRPTPGGSSRDAPRNRSGCSQCTPPRRALTSFNIICDGIGGVVRQVAPAALT